MRNSAFDKVTSRRDFLPFGEEITQNVGGRTASLGYGTSDTIRQKFTGYQKDAETSLDFAEARMYANTPGKGLGCDVPKCRLILGRVRSRKVSDSDSDC